MESGLVVVEDAKQAAAAQRRIRWVETRQSKQTREEKKPVLVYPCACGATIVCPVSAEWKKQTGICAICGSVV